MLDFLVDKIFLVFRGKVFQQIFRIPMGTNCAPLLADIFRYSYEPDLQSLLSTGKKKLASQFNFTYRYIDDVLSINNPDFENYLGQMYPAELEIKNMTESNTSTSYLDLFLSIGRDGQLRTSLYNKHDNFNFHITKDYFGLKCILSYYVPVQTIVSPYDANCVTPLIYPTTDLDFHFGILVSFDLSFYFLFIFFFF